RLELADSPADLDRIDARLDRRELALDLLLDRGDLTGEAFALVAVAIAQLPGKAHALAAEVGETIGAEYARGEEAVDQRREAVLADVLPLAVADRLGGPVAVGGPVAAGVVGRLALARAALHTQGVVPGGAMDDAAQQVRAFLRAATAIAALSGAAPLHLGLRPLELLIRDQRLVALVCLDPFVLLPAHDRTDA